MMRNKTYLKKVRELQAEYREASDEAVKEFDRRISIEYDLAYWEMAAKLRALLVDVNYEFFHSSDGFLRPKVYAFTSNGLAMFHDKAYKGRPSKPEIQFMKYSPDAVVTEKEK